MPSSERGSGEKTWRHEYAECDLDVATFVSLSRSAAHAQSWLIRRDHLGLSSCDETWYIYPANAKTASEYQHSYRSRSLPYAPRRLQRKVVAAGVKSIEIGAPHYVFEGSSLLKGRRIHRPMSHCSEDETLGTNARNIWPRDGYGSDERQSEIHYPWELQSELRKMLWMPVEHLSPSHRLVASSDENVRCDESGRRR